MALTNASDGSSAAAHSQKNCVYAHMPDRKSRNLRESTICAFCQPDASNLAWKPAVSRTVEMAQVSDGSGTGGAATGRRSRMPLVALTLAIAFALLVPPASAQVSGGGTEPGVDSATPVGGSAPDTNPEPPALEVPTPTPEPSATQPASGPDTQAPTLEPTPVPTQETAPQPPAPSPETTEVVQPPTEPSAPSSGPQLPAASEPPPAEAPAPPSETAPDSSVLEHAGDRSPPQPRPRPCRPRRSPSRLPTPHPGLRGQRRPCSPRRSS